MTELELLMAEKARLEALLDAVTARIRAIIYQETNSYGR